MSAFDFKTALRGKKGVAFGTVPLEDSSVDGLKSIPLGHEKEFEKQEGLDYVLFDASLFPLLPVKYLLRQLRVRLQDHGLIVITGPFPAGYSQAQVIQSVLKLGRTELLEADEGHLVFRVLQGFALPAFLEPTTGKPLRYEIADTLNDALKRLKIAQWIKGAFQRT